MTNLKKLNNGSAKSPLKSKSEFLGAIIEGANRPERGLRWMSSEKAPTPAGRREALAAKASEETRRCEAWLLRFIQSDQPKFLTKAELRDAAIRELRISKNAFDYA